MATLGLDIGGASLKGATSQGWARSARFALWKSPDDLPRQLRELVHGAEFDRVAVTMTGELCDGFETKEEGVARILDAVEQALGSQAPIDVWQTTGRFTSVAEARARPWETGAANWLAIATFAARYAEGLPSLLFDIGSTTTDIIPIVNGKPIPQGRTDPQRLASGELVYQGVRRTPICAVLRTAAVGGTNYRVMAELFASSLDAYLLLEEIAEDPSANDSADQRAETIPRAIDRLSRMIGSDRSQFQKKDAHELACQFAESQRAAIGEGVRDVLRDSGIARPKVILVSGEGEFLARKICRETVELQEARVVSLADKLSAALSRAACAYAVATLAEEAAA